MPHEVRNTRGDRRDASRSSKHPRRPKGCLTKFETPEATEGMPHEVRNTRGDRRDASRSSKHPRRPKGCLTKFETPEATEGMPHEVRNTRGDRRDASRSSKHPRRPKGCLTKFETMPRSMVLRLLLLPDEFQQVHLSRFNIHIPPGNGFPKGRLFILSVEQALP